MSDLFQNPRVTKTKKPRGGWSFTREKTEWAAYRDLTIGFFIEGTEDEFELNLQAPYRKRPPGFSEFDLREAHVAFKRKNLKVPAEKPAMESMARQVFAKERIRLPLVSFAPFFWCFRCGHYSQDGNKNEVFDAAERCLRCGEKRKIAD